MSITYKCRETHNGWNLISRLHVHGRVRRDIFSGQGHLHVCIQLGCNSGERERYIYREIEREIERDTYRDR